MEMEGTSDQPTIHHKSLFGMSAEQQKTEPTEEAPAAEIQIVSDAPPQPTREAPQMSRLQTEVLQSDTDEVKMLKVHFEQQMFSARNECTAMRRELERALAQVATLKNDVESLIRDRSKRMEVMLELEAERDKIMLAKNENEQKAEMLMRQKEELSTTIDRLNHDKCILAVDIQSLKSENDKLIQKNCLLQTELDEIAKGKRLFEFEKERWEQEKEVYLHNKEWFMNELKERDTKLTSLRIESFRIAGELQAEKATLSEECDSLKEELNKVRSEIISRDEEIDKLGARIKEILEERAAKVNKLEEELMASERLIAVYKEASEEAENHLQELNADFEERGRVLDESKEAYASISEKLEEQRKEFEEEMSKKEVRIAELSDELEKANELLKTKHRATFTEEELAELSPAASAAASLIRGGFSLTGIYREHCRVVAELEQTKAENVRLENYFRELVEDIEKKTPLLARQRETLETALSENEAFRSQLKEADEGRQKLISARDSALQELQYTKAELERYQRDNEDLSRQTRHLLHAIEVNNASSNRETDSPPMSEEDRDILWSSIGELQKVNQKLMSDLNSVKANSQRILEEANSAEIKRLTDALEEAMKKLEAMRDQNTKQNVVIEQVQQQRDTYKRLAEEKKPEEESSVITRELSDAKALIAELRTRSERADKSLEIYREEKRKAEEIWQNRIEQQFALISELRTTNGKLQADIFLQKQTQETLAKQSQSDATELTLLRERAAKLDAQSKATDQRAKELQCELLESRAEVGRLKSDIDGLTQQIATLRSSEARLHQELQVVRESNYSNEKIANTIQQLQSRLEISDEEKLKQLDDQLTVARNENDSLKKFIHEISEQHRVISLDLKMTVNKVETERDQAVASKKSAEQRLAWKEKEVAEWQAKYDDLMRQINGPGSTGETTIEGHKKQAQQLRNKVNYLENQLADLRDKLDATEKKLSIKENELEELTKISTSMESTLVEQTSAGEAERRSLKTMLELANSQVEASSNMVTSLRSRVAELEQRCSEKAFELEQAKLDAQKQLADAERRYLDMDSKRSAAETRANDVSTRCAKQEAEMKMLTEERTRLADEVTRLETDLKEMEGKVNSAELAKIDNDVKLDETRNAYQTEIAMLRAEKSRVEESLQEVQNHNNEMNSKVETLIANLTKLSERNAFLERATEGEQGASVGPVGRSASALYDVIKFLQSENRQATERTMNAELRWKRLEAQQAGMEERRIKLEEEVRKLRAEAEAGVRALAEKSEVVSRLTLLQGVQRENQTLKGQLEKVTAKSEELAKKISEMQARLNILETEKLTDKGKLQHAVMDLQAARNEANMWKDRHAQAMTSLGQFGPEKVTAMTGELEALKRRVAALITERDSAKQEMNKAIQQAQSSATNSQELAKAKEQLVKLSTAHKELNTKFEQARSYARQYRTAVQTLKTEKEGLEKKIADLEAEKSNAGPSEETAAELVKLRQELLSARTENEQLKQKISSTAPRTGWPVEPSTSAALPPKANVILQTQMKQIESLNQQNKELKTQLEEVAAKFKENQEKLAEVSSRAQQVESLSDSRDELQCRLTSITSMMMKKDEEITKLKDESQTNKQQLEESRKRIEALEEELKQCRQQLAQKEEEAARAAAAAGVLRQAGAPEQGDTNVKPVSSSTAAASVFPGQITQSTPAGASSVSSATEVEKQEVNTQTSSVETSAAPGTLPFSFASPIRPESTFAASAQKTASASAVVASSHKTSSVSTTSEQSPAIASSSEKVGVSLTATPVAPSSAAEPGATSSINKSPFASFTGFRPLSSSPTKSAFTPVLSPHTAVQQSNTVSQSSTGAISTSVGVIQQHKPAQQNVISGSGDGTNVISSSGSSNSANLPAPAPLSSTSLLSQSSESVGSAQTRKRTLQSQSDQSSSVETESDVQDSVKRQRSSPSEPVSTSGRFMPGEPRASGDKRTGAEDEAEQEQQESVETTTNPEDEGVGEEFLEEEDGEVAVQNDEAVADMVDNDDADVGVVEDHIEGGEEEEEEDLQEEMRVEGQDEETTGEEDEEEPEVADDLDETLGEGGDEEFDDEMEDEEEYEDEEDFEDDEEEVSESHNLEYGIQRGRSRPIPPMHGVVHSRHVDEEDDDVIVIGEDDDEEEVSHSQSPADQSMDEADEGPARAPAVHHVDASNDEPHRAERENEDDVGEAVLRSRDLNERGGASDHLELQQSSGSRMDSNSQHASFPVDQMDGDEDTNSNGHGDSEAAFLPTGEMELSQSIDTAPRPNESGEVVSASGLQTSRDSSPFVVNIESDSRGASSTVAQLANVESEESGGADSPRLVIGGEEEEEGGNEVAEEEHGDGVGGTIRNTQTDDEAGTSEPSTSAGDRERGRIRIRCPDIDEPSSSSADRPQPETARRGGRFLKTRRMRGRRPF